MESFADGPTLGQIEQAIADESPLTVTVRGAPVTFLVADREQSGEMVSLVGTVLYNEERIPCRLLVDPARRSGMIHIP